MENKKSVVEQVKDLLFSSEDSKQDFVEVKTSEGVILNISVMEAEGTIEVVSEDGLSLAPIGEYVIEDGSIIVVGVEGVISEIKEATEEEVVEEEEMAVEVVEDVIDTDTPKEEESSLEARLDALEETINSKFESIFDKFAKVNEAQALELDELKANFSAFKSEPIEDEIKISKSDVKSNKFATLGNIRRNK